MAATVEKQTSLGVDEEECLSQECLVEMSSQDSLSSTDTGKLNIDTPPQTNNPTNNISPCPNPVTVVDPIPRTIQNLVHTVLETRQPALRKFRRDWKKLHNHNNETPSAFMATREAQAMRQDFTQRVVHSMGSHEQAQWAELTEDTQDTFLCHLFLPPGMGGFLPEDDDDEQDDL